MAGRKLGAKSEAFPRSAILVNKVWEQNKRYCDCSTVPATRKQAGNIAGNNVVVRLGA